MGQNFDMIEDMKWEEDRAENRLLVYGVGTQVTLRICNRLFKVSLITEIELNSFLIIFFHSIRPCPMWYRSTQDLFASFILHVMISRTPDFFFCNWHLTVSRCLSTVSTVWESKKLSPTLSTKPHSKRICHSSCFSKCRDGKSPTPTEL